MSETVTSHENVGPKPLASSGDHSPSRELGRLESGAHKLTSLTGSMLQEGINEITTVGSHLLWWAAVTAAGAVAITGVVVYSFLTLTGELANLGAERWALSPTERALFFVGLNALGILGVVLGLLAVHALGRMKLKIPSENDSITNALHGPDLASKSSDTASRSEPPSRFDVIVAKMNLTITRMARALKHSVNPVNWVRSAPGFVVVIGLAIALYMLRGKKRQLRASATTPHPKTNVTAERPTALLSVAILLFWKEVIGPLVMHTVRGVGVAALEEFLKDAPTKSSTEPKVTERKIPPITPPSYSNDSVQSLHV